jgi:hypothetical protein
MPFLRYCDDYTAYITQASQFAYGQNNYTFISAAQGQIFYPASHLWHYWLAYKLHFFTQHSEFIMKLLHLILYATVQFCIGAITFQYFKNDHRKA